MIDLLTVEQTRTKLADMVHRGEHWMFSINLHDKDAVFIVREIIIKFYEGKTPDFGMVTLPMEPYAVLFMSKKFMLPEALGPYLYGGYEKSALEFTEMIKDYDCIHITSIDPDDKVDVAFGKFSAEAFVQYLHGWLHPTCGCKFHSEKPS